MAQLAGSRLRADSDRIHFLGPRGLPRPLGKADKGGHLYPTGTQEVDRHRKAVVPPWEEILSQRDAAPAHTLQRRAGGRPNPHPTPPGAAVPNPGPGSQETGEDSGAAGRGSGDWETEAKGQGALGLPSRF